ncbi:chloride channel protein [Duganella violaceipulchra]|uniref:Chloride channel protein n=1 Tax=Duganella violaceipulchra TaxID=2849652 RepID=A0AA41L564_9BURK|nr:chloride channel protein [Duganella violaceicalia]MBV6323769.1 chloride channel protein [Duganella violaceicalia]MCP2007459.1 H+/Cl- antiporter ClcA [Duganella violaceicalia]
MINKHNTTAAFNREFRNWRIWATRALVVAAAAAAGLAVTGFTWLGEQALSLFMQGFHVKPWLALLWTPLCTAAIVWITRRHFSAAAGSGIPQVMAALDPLAPPHATGRLVSFKLSLAKVGLTTWGLLAGLSLGREGPSVQVAAGIMLTVRRWLPERSSVSTHGLLVAGGAAGIAAAFNTPLAGVMFAIEELSRTPEQRSSGLLMSAIVLAGLIAVSVYGNATYFGIIHTSGIDLSLLLPGALVALTSGLAGGLFSRLLQASLGGHGGDALSRLRRAHPVVFAGLCGLLVAVIGVVSASATFGSGYSHTRDMVAGRESVPAQFLLLKFVATWLTTWSGVPAGIFAPSLAIGAALGNDIALLLHSPQATALIALGMVGFLAAATQAPLTSFIIVMEMVDGHAMVLSLMACAMVARTVSHVISAPLYTVLALQQLANATALAAPPGDGRV